MTGAAPNKIHSTALNISAAPVGEVLAKVIESPICGP